MKYCVFFVLLAFFGDVYSMNGRSCDLTPGHPSTELNTYSVSSRGCFRCRLSDIKFQQQQEKDALSCNKSVLEESFVCASRRLSTLTPESKTPIDNNRWMIFARYVKEHHKENTEEAVKALETQVHGLEPEIAKRGKCLLNQAAELIHQAKYIGPLPFCWIT